MFLQNGIVINKLIFSSVNIDKLYIKWNKKLSFNAENINITIDDNESEIDFSLKELSYYLKRYQIFTTLVEDIHVNHILLNNTDYAHVTYQNKTLHVKGIYNNVELNTTLFLTKKYIIKASLLRDIV